MSLVKELVCRQTQHSQIVFSQAKTDILNSQTLRQNIMTYFSTILKNRLRVFLVIFLSIMCFFLYTPQTQTLDLRISDLIGISNKVPASGDVVIVELDSKAIENAGAFPIPHSYIADLLEKLDNAGAKNFILIRGLQ